MAAPLCWPQLGFSSSALLKEESHAGESGDPTVYDRTAPPSALAASLSPAVLGGGNQVRRSPGRGQVPTSACTLSAGTPRSRGGQCLAGVPFVAQRRWVGIRVIEQAGHRVLERLPSPAPCQVPTPRNEEVGLTIHCNITGEVR